MKNSKEVFIHLANILSYPDKSKLEHVEPLYSQSQEKKTLDPFYQFTKSSDLVTVEELFTKTFDLNASCCLEIGWHLYGEQYQRGEFLVNMRQTLAEEKISESNELPDHLSHCLRLLPLLEKEDEAAFAQEYMLPAVVKIAKGMKQENPYTCVIAYLQDILSEKYGEKGDVVFKGEYKKTLPPRLKDTKKN